MLQFTFKSVKPEQRNLIHDWLVQDHIKERLHGEGKKKTIEDLEKSFEGRNELVPDTMMRLDLEKLRDCR